MLRNAFLPSFLLVASLSQAQKLKKEDQVLITNLKTHIGFLANDKLEGRRTGTEGERLAALYISGLFQAARLEPKGTDNYYQPFEVGEGRIINPATHLVIDEKPLELGKDFFPLTFSPNGSLTAVASMSLQESGTPWFLDLRELLEANKDNPNFDVADAVKTAATKMAAKGATALLVYNSSALKDNLAFDGKEQVEAVSVPVIYVTPDAAKKYLSDETASLDINLKTDIGPKVRKGANVVGFINNGAANTVVLGAHFDHLGWGEDNNSMQRSGPKAIHNGADDNASGTAALIELARLLKASKFKQNNYLFIAFSGEELGLYGSKYFVEHPTVDLSSIDYMINMDMVGRLSDSSHAITVGGYGTTPTWGQLYSITGKKRLWGDNLVYHFDSSGVGPSDHTSFYNKGIPVLFYFTGIHPDYHRPSDDADKINYVGEAAVIKHILSVVEKVNASKEKLAFTKTRDLQMGSSTKFSVTMGLMPDYTFSGAGLRIDAISEARPAQKAGLQAGDIITALGDNKVTSIETYMQALGKFKKGDTTPVTYIRNNATLTTTVQF